MKSTSAILVRQKKELVIDQVDVPSLREGKVLVQIKATRICGSQIGEIDGVKGHDPYLPHLLGHEAGGVAVDIGPGVTRIKEGNHVVCHWRPSVGLSGENPIYKWNNVSVNAGPITTFSEYAIISENRLTVIDSKYNHEISALLADTITTGFGIISNDAKLKIGQSVCIIGVGGIGLGVVLGAKLAGAYPIIAVDIHQNKLELAKKTGASHCVNPNETDLKEKLSEVLDTKELDVMIEGTGNSKMIENAYELTGKNGICVLFGVMKHNLKASFHTLPLHLGKTLKGSEGGSSKPEQDIPNYLRMMDADLFKLDNFVSHRFKIHEINKAIQLMKSGGSTHTLITF